MVPIFKPTNCLSTTQIEAYLAETLSQEERMDVETHLLDCELCSTAIEGFAFFPIKEELPQIDVINKQLEDIAATKATPVLSLVPNRRRIQFNRIAAAILLLIIPLSAFFYWKSTQKNRLYEQNYSTLEITKDTRSATQVSSTSAAFQIALKHYEDKQFETSLSLFEDHIEQAPEDIDAYLYAGISALELNYLQKAQDYLSTVQINSPRYFQDATWYLSLVSLRMNDMEKARLYLKQLLQEADSFYTPKAKELLDSL